MNVWNGLERGEGSNHAKNYGKDQQCHEKEHVYYFESTDKTVSSLNVFEVYWVWKIVASDEGDEIDSRQNCKIGGTIITKCRGYWRRKAIVVV